MAQGKTAFGEYLIKVIPLRSAQMDEMRRDNLGLTA